MRPMCLLIGALAFAVLVIQVSANCLCGATGEDYCSCKSFRPLPKLLDKLTGPPPKLPPIGDRCYCEKSLVEPAIPPKPCCPKKLPVIYPKSTCGCGIAKPLPGAPCPCAFQMPMPSIPYKNKNPGIPADPVSVNLAYQMGTARRYSVPESKVSFGFYNTPLNGMQRICSSNIPEEKLYSINREVIELKRKTLKKEEDDEIIEEESEEDDIGPDPSYLTYGELGYCPEKFPSAKFIPAPPIDAPLPEPSLPDIGNCGFKPGKIVPFNTADLKYNYGDCLEDV